MDTRRLDGKKIAAQIKAEVAEETKLLNAKGISPGLAAVLVGVLVFLLQKWLFKFELFYNISLIDYSDFSLLFGFLLGSGAILGDLVGSYFKRREEIKEGESWKPWDQLDFVIGGLVLSWFVYVPKIEVVAVLFVLSPFLHVLFCRFGYWLRIKKSKF